jgi:hypothetical protein
LLLKDINPDEEAVSFTEYAKYVLREGVDENKRELVKVFGKPPYLHKKEIFSASIS